MPGLTESFANLDPPFPGSAVVEDVLQLLKMLLLLHLLRLLLKILLLLRLMLRDVIWLWLLRLGNELL